MRILRFIPSGILVSRNLRLASCLGVAARVLSALCRFVSVPLAIGLLTPDGYGLWLVIGSLTAWLSIADFGIPGALQNILISLRSRGAIKESRELVWFSFRLFLKVGLIAWVFGTAAIAILPVGDWLNVPASMKQEFVVALWAGVAVTSGLFVSRLGPSIAYAHGFVSVPAVAEIIGSLVTFIMLVAVYLIGIDSLLAMVIIGLVGQICGLGLLSFWVLKREGYLPLGQLSTGSIETRRLLLSKGGYFFLNLIGELLIFQSIAFVISHKLGPIAVSRYAVPMILFNNTIMIQAVIQRSVVPSIRSNMESGRHSIGLRLIRNLILSTAGFGTIISLGIVLLGPWFIKTWTGGAITMTDTMKWGLACFVLIASFDNPISSILISLECIKQRCVFTFAFGAVQAAGSYFLLTRFDIQWIPWVSAASLAVCALVPGAILLSVRIKEIMRNVGTASFSS
jgi:O-antigen/teichoic acid export membrane protein